MVQKISADRIYETSVTTGTGEYTLAGAQTGFQPVSVIGANNYDGFFITDDTNWEVIIGTYIASPSRLQRTAVLASSNAGAAVNWGAGTKKIRSGLGAWAANPRLKTKSVAGSANVTLTAEEQRCNILVLTGAITANINVIVDETPWAWSIYNNTTGAYTVTVKTSGGTGVTIDQGRRAALLCDGTTVVVADDAAAVNTSTAVSVAGTVDAITAVFAPVMTRHNPDVVLMIECTGANTSTTPTVNPDSLGAITIVKGSNQALAVADIPGADFVAQLRYDTSLNKYQLLNPATGVTAAGGGIVYGGRVTLTSGVPVTTSDVAGATAHYYTPFVGDTVPIYNGSAFTQTTFTELTQLNTDTTKSPAAVAASKAYDLFVWDDAGTLRCTRGPAYTSDTNRGTGAGTSELVVVKGVLLNANAITNGPAAQRGTYVGSIYSDASSLLNATAAKQNVATWPPENQVPRPLRNVAEGTNSWTYTGVLRQANANAANQLEYMSAGLVGSLLEAEVLAAATPSSSTSAAVGIGIDSTTVNLAQHRNHAQTAVTLALPLHAQYQGYPGIGRHTVVWLEESVGGTWTWYGDNGTTIQYGIFGTIMG